MHSKQGVISTKTLNFSVRIYKLSKFLNAEHNDYIISKQILRSSTSVGAMVRESQYAESTADFRHKLSIAQKEISETIYWLELLRLVDCLSQEQFESLYADAEEIIKLLTAIIKTVKRKESQNQSNQTA
jgi:four helix bundle protein